MRLWLVGGGGLVAGGGIWSQGVRYASYWNAFLFAEFVFVTEELEYLIFPCTFIFGHAVPV